VRVDILTRVLLARRPFRPALGETPIRNHKQPWIGRLLVIPDRCLAHPREARRQQPRWVRRQLVPFLPSSFPPVSLSQRVSRLAAMQNCQRK